MRKAGLASRSSCKTDTPRMRRSGTHTFFLFSLSKKQQKHRPFRPGYKDSDRCCKVPSPGRVDVLRPEARPNGEAEPNQSPVSTSQP